MYLKIVHEPKDGEYDYPPLMIETKAFSARRVMADDDLIPEELDVGDYGLYHEIADVRLILYLDENSVALSAGTVYVMNNDGKTIDTINC